MAEPDAFHALMRNVILIVIALLIIFSIASYESFGSSIKDMVTLNLPHDGLTTTV